MCSCSFPRRQPTRRPAPVKPILSSVALGGTLQFLHPRRPNLLAFSRGFFPAVSGRRVKRDAAPNRRPSFPGHDIVNVVRLSRVAGVNSCYSALSPGKSPSALPHPPFTCAPPAPPGPDPVPTPSRYRSTSNPGLEVLRYWDGEGTEPGHCRRGRPQGSAGCKRDPSFPVWQSHSRA